ncbi:MAG: hypothetical protein ACPHQQ_05520 [Candidatus Puniceispirillum sp.]
MTIDFYQNLIVIMFQKWKSLLQTLGFKKLDPIITYRELFDFIDSRAAFVSQTTLYTYVKARAGMQHPKLFANPDFLTSLRIARWHIYGAACGDLTLFAGAQVNRAGILEPDQLQIFCTEMIEEIFAANPQEDIDPDRFMQICEKGKQRIAFADWQAIEDGATAFQSSSDAVFKWAPIADELKMHDEEIVRNSIHLRWIGVRRDLKEIIKPELIIDDWQKHHDNAR